MANGSNKDVVLRIRSQSDAEKAFREIADAIEETQKQLGLLNRQAERSDASVDGLAASFKAIESASKKLQGTGALDQYFRETGRSAIEAQRKLSELRRELEFVAQRNAKLRAAGNITRDEEKQYDKLQLAVKKANAELQRQIGLYQQLKTAGVGGISARAQQAQKDAERVVSSVRATVEARERNIQKIREEEAAAKKAAAAQVRAQEAIRRAVSTSGSRRGGLFAFDDTGPRQTLDVYQRLRGQILSLTATYVGLYGIVNQFNQALEEQQTLIAVRSRLQVVLGTSDFGAISAELERVRSLADRLGQDFLTIADNYSRFSVSAKLSGATAAQIESIFVNLAEAATVMNLSGDQLAGTFRAVEQSFSKGKIQAEELRQQLGDRLPGAVAQLAKSLNISQEELNDRLEKGLVPASNLVGLFQALNQTLAAGLPNATNNLRASLARLGNDVRDLRAEFFEGFSEGLNEALGQLNKTLKSADFKDFARDVGRLVGEFVKLGAELVKILPVVTKIAALFIGFRALASVGAVIGRFRERMIEAGLASAAAAQGIRQVDERLALLPSSTQAVITKLDKLQALLAKGLALGTVGLAAYELTSALRESDTFLGEYLRKLGVVFVNGTALAAANVRELAGEQGALANEMSTFSQAWDDAAKSTADWNREAEEAAKRNAAIAAEAEKASRAMNELAATADEARAILKSAEDTLIEYKVEIDQTKLDKDLLEINEKFDTLVKQFQSGFERAIAALDRSNPIAAGRARLALERELEKKLQEVQTARVAAIAKVQEEADEKERKKRDAENKKRLEEAKRLADQQKALEDELLKAVADTLQERIALIEREYTDTVGKIGELFKGNQAKIDEFTKLARAAADLRIEEERKEELTKALTKLEKDLNDQLQIRQYLLDGIAARKDAGLISETQAAEETRAVYEQTNQALLAQIDSLIATGQLTDAQIVQYRSLKLEIEATEKASRLLLGSITKMQAADQFAQGLGDAFFDWADGIKSANEALRDFAADFLRFIAEAIIREQALAIARSLFGVAHEGGIAGSLTRKKAVSPLAFMAAPRYHSGGVVGLAPSEVPAILQRGEEVLTRDDPRHVLNGGANQASSQASPQNIQVINTVDSESVFAAGAQSRSGQTVILNIIRANSSAIKQALA